MVAVASVTGNADVRAPGARQRVATKVHRSHELARDDHVTCRGQGDRNTLASGPPPKSIVPSKKPVSATLAPTVRRMLAPKVDTVRVCDPHCTAEIEKVWGQVMMVGINHLLSRYGQY